MNHEKDRISKALRLIPGVGRSKADRIVNSGFDSLENLKEICERDLVSIDGIGKSTASKISSVIERCRERGFEFCGQCGYFLDGESCAVCGTQVMNIHPKEIEVLGDHREECTNCGYMKDDEHCPVCDISKKDVDEPMEIALETEDLCKDCGAFMTEVDEGCTICGHLSMEVPPEREKDFFCGQCGAFVDEEMPLCTICGSDLSSNRKKLDTPRITMYPSEILERISQGIENTTVCDNCGAFMPGEEGVCSICGSPLMVIPEEPVVEEVTEEHVLEEGTEEPVVGEEDMPTGEEVDSIMVKVEELIDGMREEPIDLSELERLTSMIREEKEKGNMEFAYRMALKVINMCGDFRNYLNVSSELREELADFVRNGWEYQTYKEEMNLSKRKMEMCHTEEGLEHITTLLEKVKVKRVELESLQGIKDGIKEVVPEISRLLTVAAGMYLPLQEDIKHLYNALMAFDKGDLEKTLTILREVRDQLEDKVGRKGISDLERTMKIVRSLGIDLPEIDESMERGDLTKKVEGMIMEYLPEKLNSFMKKGVEQLELEKNKGKDTSRPLAHLKKVLARMKRKDYMEALEHVEGFNREMENLE